MKQRLFIKSEGKNITLAEMFEKFILFKKMNNVSTETVTYYENCFKFFGWFYDTGVPCDTVTQDIYYGYVQHLQKKDIKAITINTYLRGIRVILYYAMELGYVKQFRISLIKAEKELKETYTDHELDLLLKKPDTNKCSFAEYRSWVMVNYLLATGNRLSTMTHVKNCDVDYEAYLIRLTKTKNRKQQIIPLSTALAKILKEYQVYRKGSPDDYLFCSNYGEQMNKESVGSAIARYNKTRGVSKTSIHLFRHTFAKKWILNGGDIFRLQRILGHSSLDIVKEYVNMFGTDLQQQFDEFNPLDNMAKNGNENRRYIKLP